MGSLNHKIKNGQKTACCDVITGTRKNKPVPDQNKQVINHNTFLQRRGNHVNVINNVPISRFHQHTLFLHSELKSTVCREGEKEKDVMFSRTDQISFRIFLGFSLKSLECKSY